MYKPCHPKGFEYIGLAKEAKHNQLIGFYRSRGFPTDSSKAVPVAVCHYLYICPSFGAS